MKYKGDYPDEMNWDNKLYIPFGYNITFSDSMLDYWCKEFYKEIFYDEILSTRNNGKSIVVNWWDGSKKEINYLIKELEDFISINKIINTDEEITDFFNKHGFIIEKYITHEHVHIVGTYGDFDRFHIKILHNDGYVEFKEINGGVLYSYVNMHSYESFDHCFKIWANLIKGMIAVINAGGLNRKEIIIPNLIHTKKIKIDSTIHYDSATRTDSGYKHDNGYGF